MQEQRRWGELTSDASNWTLTRIFLALLDLAVAQQVGGEQQGSSWQGKLYSIHRCHGNICRCWAFSSQNVLILVRNSFTSLFFWASNSCNPSGLPIQKEKRWSDRKKYKPSYKYKCPGFVGDSRIKAVEGWATSTDSKSENEQDDITN